MTNPERTKIADLDSIPWPDRGQIDQARYVDVWREKHGMGSVNMITARGCPYKCNWCSHAVFGYTHRRRSYLDSAAELEHIMETYRPDQVWYADDVFTISHPWLFGYAKELKRRNLRVPFETISRADRMMKDEVLQTLADMGCYRIWIGSESGSQRILDGMERGVKVEQVLWAAQAAKRYGIQVGMFLMWGYPGEQIDDIAATVDLVRKCQPDIHLTTVAYPIKNTGFFRKAGESVVIDKRVGAGDGSRLSHQRPPFARLLQTGRFVAEQRSRGRPSRRAGSRRGGAAAGGGNARPRIDVAAVSLETEA